LKWSLYSAVEQLYERMNAHDSVRLAKKIEQINVGSAGDK
jgi:hypothetical protein